GDALILRETLAERGHDVELMVIEDGDKALHYFQIKAKVKEVPPPHCILLDANLPIVTGAQLLRFIRSSSAYDDTPVYIFASEAGYRDIIQSQIVSKETFLTKPESWEGFLELSDLLMESAQAKKDNVPAMATDSKPEVHAEGALRRQDTKEQRNRADAGPTG
ncbi:MAG TPA: response regulator, partial [Planctomycetota bacterium]|nr:response regulator [Planctomycetota bacterium]